MRFIGFLLLSTLLLTGCAFQVSQTQPPARPQRTGTLTQARQGFKTTLIPLRDAQHDPVEPPPSGLFRTVDYPASDGLLPAYLSVDPADGKKHPAILWITGGDCNTIGNVWSKAPRKNDQTAAQYRQAGVVMMFPSLRGGNQTTGPKEGFFGEVEDVLAAAKYLAAQPCVDPQRVYLGGHSTGGTLAMLVAESSPRFRAVFAFGPVEDVSRYGQDSPYLPFDVSNREEVELRSPGYWLSSIQSPVWVIEGEGGNIRALRTMRQASQNPQIHFIEIRGADHFATLAPTNELIAKKIVADTGAPGTLTLSEEEVNRNFAR